MQEVKKFIAQITGGISPLSARLTSPAMDLHKQDRTHRKRGSTSARGRVEQENGGKDELLEILVSYDS